MTLAGWRVLAFESRRSVEIAELIRRHGGEPLLAPALREVPIEENPEVFDYLAQLEAGAVDVVILMTGVGLRTLVDVAAARYPRERLADLLRSPTLVARGPKPVAALRELGLRADVTVPPPNTWRELLATLDAQCPIAGKRVAVQEYGVANDEFIAGLVARRADVLRVPIYRWALPEDLGPLRHAVESLAAATVDAALFTSATQVHHLFQIARIAEDHAASLRVGAEQVLIGSIGPLCSEALAEYGLAADFEPDQGKMGQLVGDLARRGPELLAAKRRRANSARRPA